MGSNDRKHCFVHTNAVFIHDRTSTGWWTNVAMILQPIPSTGSRWAVAVDDEVTLGRGGACRITDTSISRTAALVKPGLSAAEIELTAEKGRVCVQRSEFLTVRIGQVVH